MMMQSYGLVLIFILYVIPLVSAYQRTSISRFVKFDSAITVKSIRSDRIHSLFKLDPTHFRSSLKASSGESNESSSYVAIGATGVFANLVVGYSLYVLKTTGCGLPPGPYGIEGLVEGISYLVIIGIAAWSAGIKIKTGSGLPAGKFGLLGAAEGLSYLSILVGLVIASLNALDFGYLPGFLPDSKCYGS